MSAAESARAPRPSLLQEYERRYGAYAFGVASLLIIWFAIVKPELQAQRTDAVALSKVASSMEAAAKTLDATADTMKDAAQIQRESAMLMNAAITRLEAVASKLN